VTSAELDRILARPGQTTRVNLREAVEVVIRYDPVVVDRSEIFVYPDIYSRNAIHSEGVYQALMAAGYDVSGVDHDDVRRLVDEARDQRAPVVMKLDDVFGDRLAVVADS